jgi:hypothetical protein
MKYTGMADLEELVLLCRSERAREYITEAVASYKAGAFRSSIVAPWIALVFDFVDKLHELEMTGDANAKAKLAEFQKIHAQADVGKSLEFERRILDMSYSDFELITRFEYDDLVRLRDDRNRCAHPSMSSIEEIYQPTAELARCHLRNAVIYALQCPPVQGKAALDRLIGQVESEYFPTNIGDAFKYFAPGPLSRPRDSLVRNFVIVLIKSILQSDWDSPEMGRFVAALNAVRKMHLAVTERTFRERLCEIVRELSDAQLQSAVLFLAEVSDTWQFLSDDVRTRIELYVQRLPADVLELEPTLAMAFRVPALVGKANTRLESVSADQLRGVSFLADMDSGDARRAIISRSLQLYRDASNFKTANSIALRVIKLFTEYLDPPEVEGIIEIATQNDQITGSNEFVPLLRHLVSQERITQQELQGLLEAHGLGITLSPEASDF